jgi:DNA-binding NtrC family response regulator
MMPALDPSPETSAASRISEGPIAILLIGPGDSRRSALCNILQPPQWEIREAATFAEAVEILNNRPCPVVVCDTEIQHGDWRMLLADLQTRDHPSNLIVSARLADERLWAEVLNLGGYDVLAQPFDRAEVLRVARMAWMDWRQKSQSRTVCTHGNLRAQAAF